MKNPLFNDMMKAAKQSEVGKESVSTSSESVVSEGKKSVGRPARQGDAALRNSFIRARVSDDELSEIKSYCFARKISMDELIRDSVLETVRK